MTPIPRRIGPERLDSLPADDPDAIHSRRDLQRLNVVMGQAGSIARVLEEHQAAGWMRQVVDLGGGDGTLLLRVARRSARCPLPPHGIVVDRHALLGSATREGFAGLGWTIESATAEVLEWLDRVPTRPGTVMIANLFLHHFPEPPLRALLARIAERSELFVACEPRRSRFGLGAVRLVGLIGCNALTRHDGLVSVRAGFRGHELTALWPGGGDWRTTEHPVGPFSHLFVARRQGASSGSRRTPADAVTAPR